MTSNLQAAVAAIEAELAHAKQGLAYFMSRIEALEKTLMQIVAVERGVLDAPRRIVAKWDKNLPFTGGDYWLNLVTVQPQSVSGILYAAIATIGFTPTKAQVKKLSQRLTFTLNAMIKEGKIKDFGKGRERRFFRE